MANATDVPDAPMVERRTPFSRWLTYERLRLGLTQRRLGEEALGIPQGRYSHLEIGNRPPSVAQIAALSDYFHERGGDCF